MKNLFFLNVLLLFLSGCGCGSDTELRKLYNSQLSLFVNDTDNFYSTPVDTFLCEADKLGLSCWIIDSLIESLSIDKKVCFHQKKQVNVKYQNVPQSIIVFSDQPFLSKASGESLNEYFLCANNTKVIPEDLNEYNFRQLDHSFVLLLKPNLGVATNSNAQFIVEIKLSDRVLYDTSQVILFQ